MFIVDNVQEMMRIIILTVYNVISTIVCLLLYLLLLWHDFDLADSMSVFIEYERCSIDKCYLITITAFSFRQNFIPHEKQQLAVTVMSTVLIVTTNRVLQNFLQCGIPFIPLISTLLSWIYGLSWLIWNEKV